MSTLQRVAVAVSMALLALASCSSDVESPLETDDGQTSPAAADGIAADEQDMREYLEWLEGEAAAMGLSSPPDVDLVRFVAPAEFGDTFSTCMTQAGFAAEADGLSGVAFGDVPTAQEQAFAEAHFTCSAQYPVHPRYGRPWSSEQRGVVYDYYVGELVPCLEAEGYGTASPPSRETFVGTTDETTPTWNPYAELDVFGQAATRGGSAARDIETKCPIDAPDELLYGDE